jgi:hypothetical protein
MDIIHVYKEVKHKRRRHYEQQIVSGFDLSDERGG